MWCCLFFDILRKEFVLILTWHVFSGSESGLGIKNDSCGLRQLRFQISAAVSNPFMIKTT